MLLISVRTDGQRCSLRAALNNFDADPLGITRHGIDRQFIAEDEFSLSKFGLSEADLDRTVNIGLPGTKGFQDPSRSPITLRALIEQLKQTYTRHIGVEYMHIPDRGIKIALTAFPRRTQ